MNWTRYAEEEGKEDEMRNAHRVISTETLTRKLGITENKPRKILRKYNEASYSS